MNCSLRQWSCKRRNVGADHWFFPFCCSSISFQNSAAGFRLIVSSVLMERRSSVSRSGETAQWIVAFSRNYARLPDRICLTAVALRAGTAISNCDRMWKPPQSSDNPADVIRIASVPSVFFHLTFERRRQPLGHKMWMWRKRPHPITTS